MSEPKNTPDYAALLARVEAAEQRAEASEKRAENAEALAAAAVRASGQDAVTKLESQLPSQAELDAKYTEVRERNIKQHWLPEDRFRASARGDKQGVPTDLQSLVDRAVEAKLEALLAETPSTTPQKKGATAKA